MVDTGRRLAERWMEKVRLHNTTPSTADTEIAAEGNAEEDRRLTELALMMCRDVLAKRLRG